MSDGVGPNRRATTPKHCNDGGRHNVRADACPDAHEHSAFECVARAVEDMLADVIDSTGVECSATLLSNCLERFRQGQLTYGVGNWMRGDAYRGRIELIEELLDAMNISCMEELLGRSVDSKTLICICALLLLGELSGIAYIGISDQEWMYKSMIEAIRTGYIPILSVLMYENNDTLTIDPGQLINRVARVMSLCTCVVTDPASPNPLVVIEAGVARAQGKSVVHTLRDLRSEDVSLPDV